MPSAFRIGNVFRDILSIVPFIILGIVFIFILQTLREKDVNDMEHHPILKEVKEAFKKIHPSYSSIPIVEGSSSYTEDKSVITLCLREPETKKFYDFQSILYVSLHELAHVITDNTPEEEHGDDFKKNFAKLIKRAVELGIYDPNVPPPSSYCGVS